LKKALEDAYRDLRRMSYDELLAGREQKLLGYGEFVINEE
jgi:hypothetical protein